MSLIEDKPYFLSARNSLTENMNLHTEGKFSFCIKCHYQVVKVTAKGYHSGKHDNVIIGYFCRGCDILYISKDFKSIIHLILDKVIEL